MAVTPGGPLEWSYHFDHVLGTSLDISVSTSSERAANFAVEIIFAEIERLRRVFSPVDPDSELGRLNQTNGPVSVSPDLVRVLGLYEAWNGLTNGALRQCSNLVGFLGSGKMRRETDLYPRLT